MNNLRNYEDILIALRQHTIIAQANITEYQYYQEMLEKHIGRHLTTLRLDGLPASDFPYVPVDIVLKKMETLNLAIANEIKAIKKYKKLKKGFEDFLVDLNGINYYIAQMYFIEDMSLKEIAHRLGYSYDYVRHLAGDLKSKFFITVDSTN